jgi:hypothetical protein
MLYVRGWVYCPICGKGTKLRRGGKLLRVRIDTTAKNLPLYCSSCKREYIVSINQEPVT